MKCIGKELSRNSMSVETVAAELLIGLNCQMKCKESFSFLQNEPELIKYARRMEKSQVKEEGSDHFPWEYN